MSVSSRLGGRAGRAIACGLCIMAVANAGFAVAREDTAAARADDGADDDAGELVRKYEILQSEAWRQAIAQLGDWLGTQSIYSPAEVRRIKLQFNDRVAAMSSYELEYLLDSIATKMQLLDTPEARDAKAWLGQYLAAMSDARRARELRNVPTILDMTADQLRQEIQRIDALRSGLRQRQQGFEARQATLADRAAAAHEATSSASRAAAARARSAPVHSPYRSGGGAPPFSDIQPRRMSVGVGPFGAFISF